jgi:hypothetical protein
MKWRKARGNREEVVAALKSKAERWSALLKKLGIDTEEEVPLPRAA